MQHLDLPGLKENTFCLCEIKMNVTFPDFSDNTDSSISTLCRMTWKTWFVAALQNLEISKRHSQRQDGDPGGIIVINFYWEDTKKNIIL